MSAHGLLTVFLVQTDHLAESEVPVAHDVGSESAFFFELLLLLLSEGPHVVSFAHALGFLVVARRADLAKEVESFDALFCLALGCFEGIVKRRYVFASRSSPLVVLLSRHWVVSNFVVSGDVLIDRFLWLVIHRGLDCVPEVWVVCVLFWYVLLVAESWWFKIHCVVKGVLRLFFELSEIAKSKTRCLNFALAVLDLFGFEVNSHLYVSCKCLSFFGWDIKHFANQMYSLLGMLSVCFVNISYDNNLSILLNATFKQLDRVVRQLVDHRKLVTSLAVWSHDKHLGYMRHLVARIDDLGNEELVREEWTCQHFLTHDELLSFQLYRGQIYTNWPEVVHRDFFNYLRPIFLRLHFLDKVLVNWDFRSASECRDEFQPGAVADENVVFVSGDVFTKRHEVPVFELRGPFTCALALQRVK